MRDVLCLKDTPLWYKGGRWQRIVSILTFDRTVRESVKYFSVKTVVLCILLTPLLYTGILPLVEEYLNPRYQMKLENRILGNADDLFSGASDIQTAIGVNISQFLRNDFLVSRLGVELDIMVTARGGLILYPVFEPAEEASGSGSRNSSWNPIGTARENYRLLTDGLRVRVLARLRHGTLGANMILGFFCSISVLIFYISYVKGSRQAEKDHIEQVQRIEALVAEEGRFRNILDALEHERSDLQATLTSMKQAAESELRKASVTEEEMFDEIVALEKKLNDNIALQKQKEKEIQELKDRLDSGEGRKEGKQRGRDVDLLGKRFAALYKNLDINRRAVNGFLSLSNEQQIKAEELIHQLDSDDTQVTVKRKVFVGKRNRAISFESLFAYNGRLYFRKTEANRIEVLAIGTKNTQKKDMEFLHNL